MQLLTGLIMVAGFITGVLSLGDKWVEGSWWWAPHRQLRRAKERKIATLAADYELDGMSEYDARYNAQLEVENQMADVNRLLRRR